MKRLAFLTSALLAATLTIGCGTENIPVSSNEDTVTNNANGRSFFTFSRDAAQRAGKISAHAEKGRTVSAVFTQVGGTLHLAELNSAVATDDLEVIFEVMPNSLPVVVSDNFSPTDANSNVLITMTVYGHTLEDMVIEFEPDGLIFDPVAMMNLQLGHDLVNTPLKEIVIWHIHGDGSVEEAVFTVHADDINVYLTIEVPGFSRYSNGGGWKPVAPINAGNFKGGTTHSRYSPGGGW
jgi:hypothetical protein